MTRLAPSKELEELLKGEMKDRGFPLRALMTSRWLDRLIPTLERDEVVVFVTRESKNMDAMPGQKSYKVKGGNAPVYDGGWIWRVTAVQRVKLEKKAKKKDKDKKLKGRKEKDESIVVGEKHEIEVVKNSMGPHLDEFAHFYSSIGHQSEPLGLDFVREVREESIDRGLVKQVTGRGYLLDGDLIAPSKLEYLRWLRSGDPLNWQKLAKRLDLEAAGESAD